MYKFSLKYCFIVATKMVQRFLRTLSDIKSLENIQTVASMN